MLIDVRFLDVFTIYSTNFPDSIKLGSLSAIGQSNVTTANEADLILLCLYFDFPTFACGRTTTTSNIDSKNRSFYRATSFSYIPSSCSPVKWSLANMAEQPDPNVLIAQLSEITGVSADEVSL